MAGDAPSAAHTDAGSLAMELTGIAGPRLVHEAVAAPAAPRPTLVSLRRYAAALVALDAGVAAAAALLALHVRLGSQPAVGIYELLIGLIPLTWVTILAWSGCYASRSLVIGPDEYRRITQAGLWLLGGLAVGSFAAHANLSRGLVAISTPLIIVATLAGRFGARKLLHRRLKTGRALHHVVVAGSAERVRDLVRHLRRAPHSGFAIVGACVPGDRQLLDLPGGTVPLLGPVADVARVAQACGADTIAIAGTGTLPEGALRRLSWELEGTGIHLVVAPALTDIAGPRISVRPLNGLPLLHVEEPTFSGGTRVVKAVTDRLLALLLILVLSPVLLGVAALIRVRDPGPVLFRQVRVGLNGRRFILWKFRTMRVGAEHEYEELASLNENDGPLFKMRRDPRVTPIGTWLRRHSLDELPQLWNVLSGTMSLVGPRPPLPKEVDKFPEDVQRRLLVKPGITGLWQVSGRSDLSWEETVRLDLHYVENWSVALDVLLLWKTVGIVLRGAGGY